MCMAVITRNLDLKVLGRFLGTILPGILISQIYQASLLKRRASELTEEEKERFQGRPQLPLLHILAKKTMVKNQKIKFQMLLSQ